MILVTGATGLVGGHLMWHLLQENERVMAIRRPTSNLEPLRTIFSFYTSQPDDFLSRIDWKIADVLNENSIHKALLDASIVYHCAAVVSLGSKGEELLDTNIRGTRHVVRAALEAGIEKFCFVSSIAALGQASKRDEIDEDSIWTDCANRSPYSRSKYYSEEEVWKGIRQGLNAVIVNPGVILGVSGTNSGSSQLFSQVNKGLMFYTNGGTGYVDVRDVVQAMIRLMESNISGERFALVGENCSNKDVLFWMADGLGKPRPKFAVGRRTLWSIGCLLEIAGKIFCFHPLIDRGTARTATHREYYSNLKIEKAIGFTFTPIDKCIKEVCDFFSKSE